MGFLAADHCELVTASAACEAFKTALECLVIRDPNKRSRLQPSLCQPMVICGLKFTGKLQRSMETFTFFFRFRKLEFVHSKNGNYNKCSEWPEACFLSYTTLEVQQPPLHREECFIALWNGKKYQASLWSSQKCPARLPPLPRLPREPLYGHMYGRFSLLCANTETSGPVTSGAKDWRQIFKENYQQDA